METLEDVDLERPRNCVLRPLPKSQRKIINVLAENARKNLKDAQEEQAAIRIQFKSRFN